MANKENAYLTVLANDGYIYCVIALYSSWLKTKSKYSFYCACTSGVSQETKDDLKGIGVKVFDLQPIDGLEVLADKLMTSGYKSWVPALGKLAIYGLEQFNKFIFLDADTYIYKNLDHLFDKPHMTAVPDGAGRPTKDYKFVPGDDYFKKFNAGMVVVEPSRELLDKIIKFTKQLTVDRPWADQNIVSELYPDWVKNKDLQLPVYYNCFGRHICEYETYMSKFNANNIYVLHLVGPKMSPTFGFDMYFKDSKHATFCGLVVDICEQVNKFILENKQRGLLKTVKLVKVPPQYDLVVPYVDSSDSNWKALFDKYNPLGKEVEAVNARNRFRGQGDFFRFFFRGIEKFIPWVHKIFLVVQSESQVPYWLNRDKVQVVLHSNFIPKEYLPTFNSTAIEMFLWNIPGLSERFIYANDDMFVTKPLKVDNFFFNGKINLNLRKFPVSENKSTIYGHHIHNGCKLIFGEGQQVVEPAHTLRGYDKNIMRDCFNRHKDAILKSISQFRTKENYNIYIYDYYQQYVGVTCHKDVPIAEACYMRKDSINDIPAKLYSHRFSILCVQDVMMDDDIYDNKPLREWFKKLLKSNSKYETFTKVNIDPEKLERIEKIVAKLPAKIRESMRDKLINKYTF